MPVDFSVRAAVDAVTGPLRRGTQDTFDAEIRRRLGSTILREFYAPYARKLYGAEPQDLTAELANRRVAASSPLAIVARAMRASQPQGRTFFYPRLGYGQICEALADACVDAGVDLRLVAPVDRLNRSDAAWR